jgi:hypothetical protein
LMVDWFGMIGRGSSHRLPFKENLMMFPNC